uniref:Putative LOC101858828 [Aplysia californica] n=1 Tax=Lepeophtheirus salmonis TaxID=72036 RepID=A0A0K2V725_LEPSM
MKHRNFKSIGYHPPHVLYLFSAV